MSFETLVRFGTANLIDTEGHEHTAGETNIIVKARDAQNELRAIGQRFMGQREQIRANTSLTTKGHHAEIKTLAAAAVKESQKQETIVERMRGRRQELTGQLNVELDVDTAREIEARSLLLPMNAAERWRAIDNAVQEGNALVFAAFVNAPFPLVGEDVLTKAKQKWGEQRNPAVAKEYADLDHAVAALGQDLRELIDGLNKIGRLSDDSMRARLEKLHGVEPRPEEVSMADRIKVMGSTRETVDAG